MVEDYKQYIKDISNETGFIQSTLEKVERLIRILEWINNHNTLKDLIVLKGGTAINIAIFNFPRLSVDIDLDLQKNVDREEMLRMKKYIYDTICQFLKANNYIISENKSKNVYALDSIVAEYQNIMGKKDIIKIEINYMIRVHILETKKIKINTDVFKNKNIEINCVHPIEIYAAKICALINRATARDLFDVYTLSKYDLFDQEEKELLRKCFWLEYIAICGYDLENMKIENIEKITKQDIKIRLLPTLKDRNPKNNNAAEMKKEVRKYLKNILVIDSKTKEFYEKYKQGIYEPELIFNDENILNRIKNHPMINWKLKN